MKYSSKNYLYECLKKFNITLAGETFKRLSIILNGFILNQFDIALEEDFDNLTFSVSIPVEKANSISGYRILNVCVTNNNIKFIEYSNGCYLTVELPNNENTAYVNVFKKNRYRNEEEDLTGLYSLVYTLNYYNRRYLNEELNFFDLSSVLLVSSKAHLHESSINIKIMEDYGFSKDYYSFGSKNVDSNDYYIERMLHSVLSNLDKKNEFLKEKIEKYVPVQDEIKLTL